MGKGALRLWQQPARSPSINWPFLAFWLSYLGIILGLSCVAI
jgi:hypothetical protein